jgi:hypothetical protein
MTVPLGVRGGGAAEVRRVSTLPSGLSARAAEDASRIVIERRNLELRRIVSSRLRSGE